MQTYLSKGPNWFVKESPQHAMKCVLLVILCITSFWGKAMAQEKKVAPLPPFLVIKTAPTLPIFGDDLNLGLEVTLTPKAAIEFTGGYHYRNPLLFWITSPLGPEWALPAYEHGWFVEAAFKQYQVFGDPSAYLSYGLRYQYRAFDTEKYDHNWALLNSRQDCFVESRERRFGTFRGMWGKMYPIKNTRLVIEAYGGISVSAGQLESWIHQTGDLTCDGVFDPEPTPTTRFFVTPWFHSGLKVGLNMRK